MRHLRLISASLFALLAVLSVNGQSRSGPTNLAVEIYVPTKASPSYIAVPSAGDAPHWLWITQFKKMEVQPRSTDTRPVTAVNVRVVNAGDRVIVSLSVFLGEKFDEEKTIGVYTLQELQPVTLGELREFGVQPFEVRLVRVAVGSIDLPRVISKAKSVELVTIENALATLPTYRLTLRNLSSRNVVALFIRVRENDRVLQSQMPQGEEGKPLIVAGGTSQILLRAPTRVIGSPGPNQPPGFADGTIEIETAAFDDGSSEGTPSAASRYQDVVNVRKIQLRKVIKLFQEALDNDLSDPFTAINSLENKIGILEPAGGIRINVMDQIRRFRLTHTTLNEKIYRHWLAASKARYEAWLGRL